MLRTEYSFIIPHFFTDSFESKGHILGQIHSVTPER